MSQNIPYSTVEAQIAKLKSQNLTILDEKSAKINLELFGYSNLIKSYRDPYIIKTNDSITYRTGVTFEQIFSLYILDKNLRNAVMASMLDLEEHIKEIAADVIAQSFGTDQEIYLKFKNYQNKKKRKQRFTLSGILETMRATLNTDKEPIHHYAEKYGNVPPWILFKSIYFSTITNYIDLFKAPQQEMMVKRLYNPKYVNKLSIEALRKLMMDTLFICNDYRNMAAHGGRIYNYNSDKRLRLNEIFNLSADINTVEFSKLLLLLSYFNYQNPKERLETVLSEEITRHCNSFPEDVTYLGQILNMNIIRQDIVWISRKSKKYHFSEHCSGIKNPQEMELSNAQQQGYIPCKRCCI